MGEGRWLLIAASSPGAAEDYAARRGIRVALLLDRRDLLVPPWRLRRRMAAAEVDAAAIHSVDWSRVRAPQLAELALGIAPVARRMLFDEASQPSEVHWLLAPRAGMRLPLEAIAAGASTVREAVALARPRWAFSGPSGTVKSPDRLLAIWPGSSSQVGGAVTHMSGILRGFRRAGIHVGLVSAGPVVKQLAASVDDIEVADPLPRWARILPDTELLAANRSLFTAAKRMAERLEPDFVYQRHRALLAVGPRLSERLGIPLVLEWNASEVWMREHWDKQAVRVPPLERLVASTERRTVNAATVVAAVSSRAAEMAIAAGAAPKRVRIVPNGVDVRIVETSGRQGRAVQRDEGALVGWVGSFGPWHGAAVLVRALPHLPATVRLRMVGDGRERPAIQSLAEELGVASRIEWTGSLPHDDALASLAQCDVLASPHIPASDAPFFGSPTKLFEYMALERPIVASRLEQIGEVLEHERTAMLVEPGDARSLAAAIGAILERPDRGAQMGLAAAEEARRTHTWDQRATDILGALTEAR